MAWPASLTEDKQRIVFVSLDEPLASDSTEAEDAVVDALTGFVLLRCKSRRTSSPKRFGVLMRPACTRPRSERPKRFVNKDSLKGIDPAAFGRETADDYLAGLLAKSMLTRLARRNVVSNWGGFAPYFIRHARSCAAVRENLGRPSSPSRRLSECLVTTCLQTRVRRPSQGNRRAGVQTPGRRG
jgi:hypothetical protein